MIPLFKTNVSPKAYKAVRNVLESGYLGEGEQVNKFSEKLQKLWNTKNVVCTNSCTSALVLALKLSGVGPGDKVICPSFTFHATAAAIHQLGAEIIWADTKGQAVSTFTTISLVEQHKPKAAILTFVGGVVPEYPEQPLEILQDICKKNSTALIFDLAHALDTHYKSKHLCHQADFSCFSFQSIKHLTTGDGGALVCRDPWDMPRANRLKFFGLTRGVPQDRQVITDFGFKFHMNDIAAAIGLANFDIALEAVEKSRANANLYRKKLRPNPDISQYINFATLLEDRGSSDWVFGIGLYSPEPVKKALAKEGVESSFLWPLHLGCPTSDHRQNYTLFIPNGFWVNPNEVEDVSEIILESVIESKVII